MGTEERYQYDQVTLLSPFAVGVAGKRTFFLAVGEKDKWLRLWMEKEHLETLSLGIEQLLFTLSQEGITIPRTAKSPSLSDDSPSGLPSAELEIVQMTLGYEEGKAAIEFLVQASGSREQDPSQVHCLATLTQIRELRSRVARICAAGRPLCSLCGGPIDPAGHNCPRLN